MILQCVEIQCVTKGLDARLTKTEKWDKSGGQIMETWQKICSVRIKNNNGQKQIILWLSVSVHLYFTEVAQASNRFLSKIKHQ